MKFRELAKYLSKLEKTASRIEITNILTALFSKTEKEEIRQAVYLSLGILAPNYESKILNLAEKMMIRVLALAYNRDSQAVTKLYKKLGDLGEVAEKLSFSTKNNYPQVTVSEVYSKLLLIAKTDGEGSQDRKISAMANLLESLDPLSSRFVARVPVGKLRLGFSEKTVIDALAGRNSRIIKEIEKAYNIRPDIGYIAEQVKGNKLDETSPQIGVPIVPMLAQRLNSPSEMIMKMGKVSIEPKFDGLRIFIHFRKKDNFLRIFTRNMNYLDENIFPELKEIGKFINAESVILDTEAVGLDHKRQMFVDFQKTIQRRRKHEIEKNSTDIPLQFQVFDILFVNGKSLIDTPYVKRRGKLEKWIKSGQLLRIDENTITEDPEIIRNLHKKYLKMGLEGIIAKRVNAGYVSGRTGWNWVKMKEEEGRRGRISDTLDLAIMGYSVGRGKRAGFGVGQFLAGVRNGDSFETVTKVGTGLSDEQFRTLNENLKKLRTKNKPKEYQVHKDLYPDFWVEPEIVVELAADEITKSPKHTSGFALRFPRLVGFRPDKSPQTTTDTKELKALYKQ